MGDIVDVQKLIEAAKNKTSARYIHRKGKRIKVLEYQYLDPQEKEELNMRDVLDWSKIDKELDSLNELYIASSNPLEREILYVKYRLVLEMFVRDDPKMINHLQNKLNILNNTREG